MQFLLELVGRKSVFILVFSSFAILALDVIGIALIFPFLSLVVSPESLLENRWIGGAYKALEYHDTRQFTLWAGVFLIVAYLAKLAGKTSLNSIRNRLLGDTTYRLADRLFTGLLQSRYALFTEQSTSEMTNIVNAQSVHSVICLESVVRIANEGILLSLVVVAALIISPGFTLVTIAVFVLLGAGVYFGLVKGVERYGRLHAQLNVLVYKYGFAMANSIKDVKIMRLEHQYADKFKELWVDYTTNEARSKTVKAIPVDLSETLVFTGIVLAGLYLMLTHQDIKAQVPMLGVLMATAVRVLPSFNRIITSYNEFRFYRPALNLVHNLDDRVQASYQDVRHVEIPFTRELGVQGLRFRYGDQDVLDGISFNLEAGGSFAFVGASGAGKSTLLDVLVGLRQAEAGEFRLDGIQFDPFGTDALRNHVGYVEHDFDRKRMERALSIARLDQFIAQQPDGLDTMVGESGVRVSGGQRQRIGIARALYRDPKILIFDEATSALDAVTERELMAEINQLSGDKTLIIVAHRLSTVEQCRVIHLLDHGKIVARGSHAELLASCPEYQALHKKQLEPHE